MSKRGIQKLRDIYQEMTERFMERDEVIRGLLAALLAGEHVLLLGPVGTAKSMLAVELCERLEGGQYFGWLLTRFSTPEELYGAISLKALEEDRYVRVTSGKLPEAHIAFLDEIFKANSAILNSLLSLINERIFHNGDRQHAVPLISLIGASNELPEEGELMALYDRFLVRFTVDYIQEDFRFLKMLTTSNAPESRATLTLSELEALRQRVEEIEVHSGYLGDLADLRRRLAAKGIVASDRRWRKSLRLLRAYALLDERQAVTQDDLTQLIHTLWSDPGEQEEVRLTLQEVFQGHEERARELLFQAREVRDYALRVSRDAALAMRASIEAHTKLKRIHTDLQGLLTLARERARRQEAVVQVIEEVEALQRQILEEM